MRCRVLVSSSGMVPSQRYLEIVLRQSIVGLGGLTIASTSHSGPGLGLISLTEDLGSAFDVGTRPSSLGGTPGTSIELLASGDVLGAGSRISSLSQMEGLNKSCVNTPGGGGSQLDLNRARALATSLSYRRIWWSSKPLNLSSSLLTSAGMPPCGSYDSSTLPLLD
jgi:hypothetical protein